MAGGGNSLVGDVILILLICFVFVLICYELKKLVNIPIGFMLLVGGYLLGTLSETALFGNHLNLVDAMQSDLIMLGILPALIFEATLSIDWYIFVQQSGKILFMATTVVLGCAVLNTLIARFTFGAYPDWEPALKLGIILSATDHVALATQMRELFAHKKLETLISGETLLNEAMVITLFSFAPEDYSGTGTSFVMLKFLELFVGGLAFGFACGVLAGICVKRITNDPVQEVLLTFVGTYFVVFVGEHYVKVSGALAVVAYGLYLVAYGKVFISPSSEHVLHSFWTIIGRLFESFLFILAGIHLGKNTIYDYTLAEDIGQAIAFCAASYVVRALVLAVHYPVFRKTMYGFTCGELVTLTAAGTKGTVSVGLALIYTATNPSTDIIFDSTMASVFSILFGTYFLKICLRKFKLRSINETQQQFVERLITFVTDQTNEQRHEMQKKVSKYTSVNWELVQQISAPERTFGRLRKRLKRKPVTDCEPLLEISDSEIRRRYLICLRKLYWHYFEEGLCYSDALSHLIASANLSLDVYDFPLEDWPPLNDGLLRPKLLKFYSYLMHIPGLHKIFRDNIYYRISLTYNACQMFIKAHDDAIEHLHSLDGGESIRTIENEAKVQRAACQTFMLEQIIRPYQSVVVSAQSNMAAFKLLKFQSGQIEEFYHHGLIEEVEYGILKDSIGKQIRIASYQLTPFPPELRSVLLRKFAKLQEYEHQETLTTLVQRLQPLRRFNPEEMLFTDQTDTSYLVISGAVEFTSDAGEQIKLQGQFVGLLSLLLEEPPARSSARALGVVECAAFRRGEFDLSLLLAELYIEAAPDMLYYIFQGARTRTETESVVGHSDVKVLGYSESFKNSLGFVVLAGGVAGARRFEIVPPNHREYLAVTDGTVILEFDHKLGQLLASGLNPSECVRNYVQRTSDMFESTGSRQSRERSESQPLRQFTLPELTHELARSPSQS